MRQLSIVHRQPPGFLQSQDKPQTLIENLHTSRDAKNPTLHITPLKYVDGGWRVISTQVCNTSYCLCTKATISYSVFKFHTLLICFNVSSAIFPAIFLISLFLHPEVTGRSGYSNLCLWRTSRCRVRSLAVVTGNLCSLYCEPREVAERL